MISSIATFGAPLLVGALLLYRIINGHWGSVAFIAIVSAVVILLYLRFVPLDDLDDEVSPNDSEAGLENPMESYSNDRPTQRGR